MVAIIVPATAYCYCRRPPGLRLAGAAAEVEVRGQGIGLARPRAQGIVNRRAGLKGQAARRQLEPGIREQRLALAQVADLDGAA